MSGGYVSQARDLGQQAVSACKPFVDQGLAALPPDVSKQVDAGVAPVAAALKTDKQTALLAVLSAATVVVLLLLQALGVIKPLIAAGGIAWYVYVSVVAIATNDAAAKTTMLIYWLVFNALVFVEESALGVIPKAVPGYSLLRMFGLSILGAPPTRAAVRLYEQVMGRPPRAGAILDVSGGAAVKPTDALLVTVSTAVGMDACECYCVLQVSPTLERGPTGVEGTKFKTRFKTGQPWNETIELRPLATNDATLAVTVMEHKQLGANKEIGTAKVDLADFKFGAPAQKLDLPLLDASGATTSVTVLCELRLVSGSA